MKSQRIREDDIESESHWPNDEGFVSSASAEMGIKMADFNAYGTFYDDSTFAPHLMQHISEVPPSDDKIYHAVRAGRNYLSARRTYYKLDLLRALTRHDANFAGGEYREFAADLLAERLSRLPDDPLMVFAAGGPLDEVIPFLRQPDVAEALLRALARERMRLCLEAVQLGRLALPIARTSAFDNVALGRTAWQSSTSLRSRSRDRRRDAEGGNDGDADAEYGFHTGFEDSPWWAVDLAGVYPVERVRLFNRKLVEHRLRTFLVETSLDFITWRLVFSDYNSQPGLLHKRPIDIVLESPVSARYVRVRLARRGVLHLAEVEVFQSSKDLQPP